ncbi:MAG: alpha/beta hydrolase, partial [Dongiaceae bacterium]
MKIEPHAIPGGAGRLEALLTAPQNAGGPEWAAIVCHPHPLFGGTMHNKVVFHLSRALSGLGWPVLRFNYRGVGTSEGKLDPSGGPAELIAAAVDDLRAALDWLAARFTGAAICGAGFSFGAHAILRLAPHEPRLARLLAVGTPAALPHFLDVFSLVARIPRPKLFIQGEADEYGPPDAIHRLFQAAADPKRLIMIPETGHFFDGRLDEL